jgi:hypothetical protein
LLGDELPHRLNIFRGALAFLIFRQSILQVLLVLLGEVALVVLLLGPLTVLPGKAPGQ